MVYMMAVIIGVTLMLSMSVVLSPFVGIPFGVFVAVLFIRMSILNYEVEVEENEL